MIKQQESKANGEKPINGKEKKVKLKYEIFLGEFTLEEYLLKEANLIIAKMKQEGNK